MVLLLSGCATAHPAGPAGPASVASGPAAWREPDRYSFVMDSGCGERPLTGRFRVTVAAGTVTDAAGLDEPSRQSLAQLSHTLVPTLGQLVQRVTDARTGGAAVARLDVDPTDGHPVRIEIDPDARAIDDEQCFTISEYRPK